MTGFESVHAWIDRQAWSAARKMAAHAIARRRIELNLNPLTLGQWSTWDHVLTMNETRPEHDPRHVS